MEVLTGVALPTWMVLAALVLAIAVGVQAWLLPVDGRRIAGALVVPLVGAVAMGAFVALRYATVLLDLPDAMLSRPIAIAAALATVLAVYAVAEFMFRRVEPVLRRVLAATRLPESLRSDVAMAVIAMALILGTFATTARVDEGYASGGPPPDAAPDSGTGRTMGGIEVRLQRIDGIRAFELPGQPMDIALVGARSGYISLHQGGILYFAVSEEGDVSHRIATDDLAYGRGVAALDGRLFVGEVRDLPCALDRLLCKGLDMDPQSGADGEAQILAAARGSVLSFDIGDDARLGRRRVLLDDLPVVSTDHGPNGMTVGPDGFVYMSIGNVDHMWWTPERIDGLTPRPDLLGTIVRFTAGEDEPEVIARGLRNVYELSFDDQGRMWAIDNDGYALSGWRAEEVLQVKPGHDYGYPYDGTFSSHAVRSDGPVWLSQHKGSAGITWADDLNLGEGLLVGSCGVVALITPATRSDRWEGGHWQYRESIALSGVPGCVTSLTPLSETELLMSAFGGGPNGRLYLITLSQRE